MPASTRHALCILREAGLMIRYASNDRVVLECRDIVVIDAPVKMGNRYSSYCPVHKDWYQIARKAHPTEKVGGRFKGSSDELWQATPDFSKRTDGIANNGADSESGPGF